MAIKRFPSLCQSRAPLAVAFGAPCANQSFHLGATGPGDTAACRRPEALAAPMWAGLAPGGMEGRREGRVGEPTVRWDPLTHTSNK